MVAQAARIPAPLPVTRFCMVAPAAGGWHAAHRAL
mgnify:CR=1 FL=1